MSKENLKKKTAYRAHIKGAPYMFLAPYFCLVCIFFLYPLVSALILSFQQTNGPKSTVFVGLSNYAFVLTDPDFYKAISNTVIYAVFSIFLQLPIALALAMLLNAAKDKTKSFFRLIIFSPNLVGQIFVGVIFSVLFVPRYGLFNRFMQSLLHTGLENKWLANPSLVLPAIIITALWMYVGYNMIYFLAGLQSVDKSLTEAAKIDGANQWQVFWNVILPAIKPVATFVVVMSTIGSFQLFELPFALLKGEFGPSNSGMMIVSYLYKMAFRTGDLGTGAAVGWLLMLMILTISIMQIKISGTMEEGT